MSTKNESNGSKTNRNRKDIEAESEKITMMEILGYTAGAVFAMDILVVLVVWSYHLADPTIPHAGLLLCLILFGVTTCIGAGMVVLMELANLFYDLGLWNKVERAAASIIARKGARYARKANKVRVPKK